MVRSFFAWLLVILVGIGIWSVFSFTGEGFVLFVKGQQRLEISLTSFIFAMIVALILAYLVMHFLLSIFHLPKKWSDRRRLKKELEADQAFLEALNALWDAKYATAIKLAEQSWSFKRHPYLSALIAKKAAFFLRDKGKLDYWSEQLSEFSPEPASLMLVDIKQAVSEDNFEQAKNLLDKFIAQEGERTGLMSLGLKIDQKLGHWYSALDKIRWLQKNKVLSSEKSESLRLRCYRAILPKERSAARLSDLWESLRVSERGITLTNIGVAIAKTFMLIHQEQKAAKVVEHLLSDGVWDNDLIHLYAHCPAASLSWLEKVSRKNRDGHSYILWALGALAVQEQNLVKAKTYLQASLDTEPSYEGYVSLAAAFEAENDTAKASECYKAAVLLRKKSA